MTFCILIGCDAKLLLFTFFFLFPVFALSKITWAVHAVRTEELRGVQTSFALKPRRGSGEGPA